MIAPVADVAPWVLGVFDLPVDPFVADSVRVVAVHRARIDELGNHALDELGKADGESFPVLEDVAPVSLIRQELLTSFVFELDRELVPRPARVPVPSAEGDRQVLAGESLELRVPEFLDPFDEVEVVELGGQGFECFAMLLEQTAIEHLNRTPEVSTRDPILIVEDSAAKDVEEHVCVVVRRDSLFSGRLESVCRSHDSR